MDIDTLSIEMETEVPAATENHHETAAGKKDKPIVLSIEDNADIAFAVGFGSTAYIGPG